MSPKRILQFLKRYLLKHPVYVFVYVCAYFLKGFASHEHFFSKEEMQKFIKDGKSIIRFGDGEINLMLDLKNHYENFSPKVKKMMKEIVCSYRKDSPYVLSIVKFINYTNEELKKIGKFNVWLPIKTVFFLEFYKSIGYMDAHNFYYDGYFEEVIAPIIKDKKIIYITKRETLEKLRLSKDIPFQNTLEIETPRDNALGKYEEIKKELDEKLLGLNKKEVVLLVAMGPVGKYLIYEYSKQGIQGIDVGVSVETMFTGKSLEYLI